MWGFFHGNSVCACVSVPPRKSLLFYQDAKKKKPLLVVCVFRKGPHCHDWRKEMWYWTHCFKLHPFFPSILLGSFWFNFFRSISRFPFLHLGHWKNASSAWQCKAKPPEHLVSLSGILQGRLSTKVGLVESCHFSSVPWKRFEKKWWA